MAVVRRLGVFCGSAVGVDPVHAAAARELGGIIAAAGIDLVYGGGRRGLMGVLADAALAAGGRVVGVIPAHLYDRESAHAGVSDLLVVDSMHARKQRMFELADAFAVLPGGLGTLDEAFEIVTWKQLRLHDKPIVIVDVAGYWQPLAHLLEHMAAQGFAPAAAPALMRFVPGVADVLPVLAALPATTLAAEPERL